MKWCYVIFITNFNVYVLNKYHRAYIFYPYQKAAIYTLGIVNSIQMYLQQKQLHVTQQSSVQQ